MRLALPVAALVVLPVVSACAQNVTTHDSSSDGGTGPISVTSSDSSCVVSADTVPAGTVVFDVSNSGSKVTEFYLYSGDGKRIVGEVENIGPGLQGRLIVTAQEGSYQTACKPGMSGNGFRADFTVTEPADGATAPSTDAVLVSRAENRYRAWVQREADRLLSATREFVHAYEAGRDDRARSLYPVARSHYEAIETVAESFGDLDPELDARQADLSKGQKWTGWHRIEKDLWPQRDPSYRPLGASRRHYYGQHLVADTLILQRRISTLTFTSDQIANGSSGLMEEVATSKVTGEEEYWSHTDLWDFAANVRGARVAFEDVKPILVTRDPALAATLTHRFAAIDRLLARHRSGSGYVLYTELSHAQIKQLANEVNALSEPLSHLTAAVLP
jgi:iron uptake system component EfeO